MSKLNPQVLWNASGTIADPEITSSRTVLTQSSLTGPKVVHSPTRIDLFEGRYIALFQDDKFVLFLAPEDIDTFPYYLILYYICYRTRINYNIVGSPLRIELPENLSATEQIIFSVEKYVLIEREVTRSGELHRLQHVETEPFSICISKPEIERYLEAATNELHLAITYFLVGCENLRYFLIEFYKALEIIKYSFTDETNLLNALGPYGLRRDDYRIVKRYANDQTQPINIGRHAPLPGSDIKHIDTRQLLTEPFSKKVWTDSVRITRLAIDAYTAYLCDHKGFGAKLVPKHHDTP